MTRKQKVNILLKSISSPEGEYSQMRMGGEAFFLQRRMVRGGEREITVRGGERVVTVRGGQRVIIVRGGQKVIMVRGGQSLSKK